MTKEIKKKVPILHTIFQVYVLIDILNIEKDNLKIIVYTNSLLIFFTLCQITAAQGPQPGDIYKEYSRTMGQTNSNWRVTYPNVKDSRARRHLPNALLDIEIDDPEGAVKAEMLIDRWGGHAGTSNKKVRFNGNDWIQLPELTTTPPGAEPDMYMYQDNSIIVIPLDQLKHGVNVFQGTCDDPQKS